MSTDDQDQTAAVGERRGTAAPEIRWLSPSAVQFIEIIEAERRTLRWISPRKRVSVQGVTIPGGVYLTTPQFYCFSFGIDPTLPIGIPEKAEPLSWSRYPTEYWRLSENQRAFYLYWLRGETARLGRIDPTPYLHSFLSGLESRLFVDGDPDDTFLDACELLAFRDKMRFQYHALNLLSWWGHLQGPKQQLIVLEESTNLNFTQIPETALALAMANSASLGKSLPVEVAAEIGLFHCRKKNTTLDLRKRFRERLKAIYPQGITLSPVAKQIEVGHSPVCHELKNPNLIRSGNPLPCLKIPDLIGCSELLGSLEQILQSIISGPHFDAGIAASIASQKRRTQTYLENEFPPPPEDVPSVVAQSSQAPRELTETCKAALVRILTRRVWNGADFNKLAQEFHLTPFGLRTQLNRWAQEQCGDLLLDGTDPIQLNPYVIEEVIKYL